MEHPTFKPGDRVEVSRCGRCGEFMGQCTPDEGVYAGRVNKVTDIPGRIFELNAYIVGGEITHPAEQAGQPFIKTIYRDDSPERVAEKIRHLD